MLLGLASPIGFLYSTVLLEHYNHYEELFGSDDCSHALDELQAIYTQYKDVLNPSMQTGKSGEVT